MTAAAPEKHGGLSIPSDVGAWEYMSGVSQGDAQIAQSGELIWTMPTITMPWAGQVTVHTIHTGRMPDWGLMGVETGLEQSTPAPSSFWIGSFTVWSETSWHAHDVNAMAQWRDLGAGTVVTPKLRVRVNFSGGPNWTATSYLYNYRVLRV